LLVLLATDFGVFLACRELLHAWRNGVSDASLFGHAVHAIFPAGFLGGWEFPLALLIGLVVSGTYARGDRRRDPGRLLQGVTLATALTLWSRAWNIGVIQVVVQFAGTVLMVWLGILGGRLAVEWLTTRFGPRRLHSERVIFVGDPEDGASRAVAEKLVRAERMQGLGWVFDGPGDGKTVRLGTTPEFWHVLHGLLPDTVVLTGEFDGRVFQSLVEAASSAGCRVLALPQHGGGGRLRPRLVWQRGFPFVELTVPSLRGQQLAVKRVMDVVGSAIGLVILSPLFAWIAFRIRRDSPGPVFFSQERVGLGGNVFRMLKFRTMRDGADAEKADFAHLNQTGDPRLFKIPNDPRITRVGAWLRRWSLDELPQLCNVLKGDMSLIGPRPFFEADLAGYADHHFGRLGAKPGITGLWQVKGRSDVVDFEEVVRLDREYIEQWSLLLDVRILLVTLPAVVRKTGAY
jgi:exopolysaccharide biosynthesis polyprenyl glycosylphosphotransferase